MEKIRSLFEEAYHSWQALFPLAGYTPNRDNTPTTFKVFSPYRGKDVVPDGFMKSIATNAIPSLPANQKAHWVECKASNKDFISLADYDKQIGGEIEALSIWQPWACANKIAAITYVTTIDLLTSRKLVKDANDKGIWILNSYAFYKIENGKMFLTFSTPFPYGAQFGQTGNIPDVQSIMRTIGTDYIEFK